MLSFYDTLGKLVTEKPVDFVGFDNVVEFNKNRQNAIIYRIQYIECRIGLSYY